METSYSNTEANLFLFSFEYKYTVKYNKFLRIFKYVNDILLFNYEFIIEYEIIYSEYFKLNKADRDYYNADFLYISFNIFNNKVNLILHDKKKLDRLKSFRFFLIEACHISIRIYI